MGIGRRHKRRHRRRARMRIKFSRRGGKFRRLKGAKGTLAVSVGLKPLHMAPNPTARGRRPRIRAL